MKKLLPQSFKNPQGFTLIELLVVIAIIAVLAVMGFAAFSGLTGRGNDARRSADIKAIADAIETQRTAAMSNYGGIAVAGTNFASGSVPVDPTSAKGSYCLASATSGTISNPTIGTTTLDGTGCHGTAPTWAALGSAGLPASTTTWRICASNELNSAPICQGSRQ